MKNNFAKKTTKILTAAILSAFVLVLFNIETVKAESPSPSGGFTYTLLQPLPVEGGYLKDNKNVTLKDYLTWVFRFVLAFYLDQTETRPLRGSNLDWTILCFCGPGVNASYLNLLRQRGRSGPRQSGDPFVPGI